MYGDKRIETKRYVGERKNFRSSHPSVSAIA